MEESAYNTYSNTHWLIHAGSLWHLHLCLYEWTSINTKSKFPRSNKAWRVLFHLASTQTNNGVARLAGLTPSWDRFSHSGVIKPAFAWNILCIATQTYTLDWFMMNWEAFKTLTGLETAGPIWHAVRWVRSFLLPSFSLCAWSTADSQPSFCTATSPFCTRMLLHTDRVSPLDLYFSWRDGTLDGFFAWLFFFLFFFFLSLAIETFLVMVLEHLARMRSFSRLLPFPGTSHLDMWRSLKYGMQKMVSAKKETVIAMCPTYISTLFYFLCVTAWWVPYTLRTRL